MPCQPQPPRNLIRLEPLEAEPDHFALPRWECPGQPPDMLDLIPPLDGRLWRLTPLWQVVVEVADGDRDACLGPQASAVDLPAVLTNLV